MKLSTLSAAVAATLALSACGGMELERTSGMTPTGSEFDKAMFSDYMTLSHQEYNEGDYRNSDVFAVRARSAGEGTATEPEETFRAHDSGNRDLRRSLPPAIAWLPP